MTKDDPIQWAIEDCKGALALCKEDDAPKVVVEYFRLTLESLRENQAWRELYDPPGPAGAMNTVDRRIFELRSAVEGHGFVGGRA